MTNQVQTSNNKIFDLEERTAVFGENVIKFIKSLSSSSIANPLFVQLIRSSTSMGANYMETDACNSKKDFINKIVICKKESKETMHWLRMISVMIPEKINVCRNLWKESHELVLIFSTIIKKKSL